MMNFSRVPRWIIDSGVYAKLSPAAKSVLPVLGICLDRKADCGRMTIDRICDLSGLSQSSAYRAIKELTDAKIVERQHGKSEFRFPPVGKQDSHQWEKDSHEREKDSHQWESHPYRSRSYTKNSHQEGASVPIPNRMIPYDGREITASEAADLIVARSKWPKSRVDRKADRLLCLVLVEMARGQDGPESAADPVNTIGKAMGVYVHAQSKTENAERFTKRLANWLEEQYGDLIAGSGIKHVA